MKILLVNKFHYQRGGAETYYFALAEGLKAAGHEVIFFSMHDDKNVKCKQDPYFVENVEYNQKHNLFQTIKISKKLIYSREAKEKFEKLIKKENPDIIHFSNIHRQLTLSIVDVAYKYKIPMVYTLHDLICACPNCVMLSPNGICESCLKGSYIPCVKKRCIKGSFLKSVLAVMEAYFYKYRHTYNKIDLYITPSNFYLQKLKNNKFTNRPIIHMANFLPLSTKFGKYGDYEGYYLFFGRISIEKGIMTLVKAFSQMPEKAILKVVGDGPQYREIEQYVKDKHLEKRIQLVGFQERDSMNRLIEGAKCVVVPSEWYENGPYTVMETLSKGVPVIGSSNGGIPEMVRDGMNGFIFKAGNVDDLYNALQKIEKMPSYEYEHMQSNAVNWAIKNYKCERYIDELIPLYNKVIKKKASK